MLGDECTQVAQTARVEAHPCRIGRRGWQRPGEGVSEVDWPEAGAGLPALAPRNERVSPVRLIDDVCSQGLKVVRAQQPEGGGIVEGDVQERLVKLAFGKLSGGPARVNRFSDSPQLPNASMGPREGLPCGDDARRVVTDLRHVGEADVLRLSSKPLAEQVDLRPAHHYQDRVTGTDRTPDERHRSGQELGHAGIKECLVAVPADGAFR